MKSEEGKCRNENSGCRLPLQLDTDLGRYENVKLVCEFQITINPTAYFHSCSEGEGFRNVHKFPFNMLADQTHMYEYQ